VLGSFARQTKQQDHIFFKFIQRKGDDGYGEGNFKAMFESTEAEEFC
jgi:4-hydroxyphenylpyruvate dioxygenase-like putative hemolysin